MYAQAGTPFSAASRLGFRAISPVFDGADEEEIEAELARAWLIERAWSDTADTAWQWLKQQEYDPQTIQDDDEVRRLRARARSGRSDGNAWSGSRFELARHERVDRMLVHRQHDDLRDIDARLEADARGSHRVERRAVPPRSLSR